MNVIIKLFKDAASVLYFYCLDVPYLELTELVKLAN